MDEILGELLVNTAALGVWLLDTAIVLDNDQHRILASATRHKTGESQLRGFVPGEMYIHVAGEQLFAEPIGNATLVIAFDGRSSLCLVRMRIRDAKQSIERALIARPT